MDRPVFHPLELPSDRLEGFKARFHVPPEILVRLFPDPHTEAMIFFPDQSHACDAVLASDAVLQESAVGAIGAVLRMKYPMAIPRIRRLVGGAARIDKRAIQAVARLLQPVGISRIFIIRAFDEQIPVLIRETVVRVF